MSKNSFINNDLHKKRLFMAVLLTAILVGTVVFTATWTYGGGAISNPGTTYGPGDVDVASYIIFREGSTYYAKNGTTRAIDYSGSNPTTVVTNAQNAFGTDGGIIHFKGQTTYEYPSTLQLRTYVIYEGEGEGTIQYRSGNYHTWNYSGGTDDWIVIRDMHFSGYGQSEAILWIQGGAEVNIHGNYFTSGASGADGIVIEGTLTSWIQNSKFFYLNNGIRIKNYVGVNPSYTIHIENNDITQNEASGILIEQGNQYGITITQNTIQHNGVAEILVNGSVRQLVVNENYFESDANIPALDIQSNSALSSSIVVRDNMFVGTAGDVGISVGLTGGTYEVHGTLITGNYFYSGQIINVTENAYDTRIVYNSIDSGNPPTNYGTRTTFEGNAGFVTENNGYSIGSGTTCVVAHGLAGAPTTVVVTPDAGQPEQWFITSINITHFVVSWSVASGAYGWYWYAAYDP